MMLLRPAVRSLLLGILAAIVAVASASPVQPAHANPSTVLGISQTLCYLMTRDKDWNGDGVLGDDDATAISGCQTLDSQSQMRNLVRVLGGNPSSPKPADFTPIDVDANQMHQQDGMLFIVAFVTNDSPVSFATTKGLFSITGTASATCGPLGLYDFAEADCDNDGASTGDGIVAIRLLANNAPRGPGTVTVSQNGINTVLNFTVVGEPSQIHLNIPRAVQAGAVSCPYPQNETEWGQVPGTPQETVMTAQILDSDGTPLTDSLLTWQMSDATKAALAATWGWTTDLGAAGIEARNVLCGASNTGTVTVTASITNGSDVLPLYLAIDPDAGKASASLSETVSSAIVVGGVAEAPETATTPYQAVGSTLLPWATLAAIGGGVLLLLVCFSQVRRRRPR